MRHADNAQFHEFVSARMERWRSAYLADGLVLEVCAYASKQLKYGSLGPVLSQAELVTAVEDVASRLT